MFKFLKDKLKGAIDKFTKKVEEESKEEIEQPIQTPQQEKVEKKEVKIKETPQEEKEIKVKEKPREQKKEITKKEIIQEEKVIVGGKKEEKPGFFDFLKKKKEEPPEKEEKKGIFQAIKEKVTTKIISPDQFDELFFDLEIVLLENNVAVEVIEKIKEDLKEDLTEKPLKRDKISEEIKESLKKSIDNILTIPPINLVKEIKEKKEKPFIIAFVGINGSGKTTTIAKMANMLQKEKLKVVLAAADTFRAASIEQLEEHGKKLNVKVIKHNYGSDPAAVVYDTIFFAKAHNIDVVLIDTAGRLHSNINLIDEMKKIIRVAKPDLKIFVGEAITGNDCIEQSQKFNEAITIDGVILAKADIDEKGGASLSINYVTKKPILYLGTGQNHNDLELFNKEKILSNLGF